MHLCRKGTSELGQNSRGRVGPAPLPGKVRAKDAQEIPKKQPRVSGVKTKKRGMGLSRLPWGENRLIRESLRTSPQSHIPRIQTEDGRECSTHSKWAQVKGTEGWTGLGCCCGSHKTHRKIKNKSQLKIPFRLRTKVRVRNCELNPFKEEVDPGGLDEEIGRLRKDSVNLGLGLLFPTCMRPQLGHKHFSLISRSKFWTLYVQSP